MSSHILSLSSYWLDNKASERDFKYTLKEESLKNSEAIFRLIEASKSIFWYASVYGTTFNLFSSLTIMVYGSDFLGSLKLSYSLLRISAG